MVLHGGYCPGCDTAGSPFTWEYGRICPADCDGISNPPVLTVADFACFMNRYAVGLQLVDEGLLFIESFMYPNCDGSTQPPVLSVADFGCFLNNYAAGCP